jgi:O-antigen/teichoic acid export membrane protein
MTVEEDAAQERAWLRQDPQLEQEWLRQNNLIYGGLIAIGVYLVQPFLTTASLDLSATICVVAFSVAIPLLAALVIVNRQEAYRRRRSKSVLVAIAQVVGQSCAFAGVVAGFWHILWIAGVALLASGLLAVAVHSAGYWRLERDQPPTLQQAEDPGDTGS